MRDQLRRPGLSLLQVVGITEGCISCITLWAVSVWKLRPAKRCFLAGSLAVCCYADVWARVRLGQIAFLPCPQNYLWQQQLKLQSVCRQRAMPTRRLRVQPWLFWQRHVLHCWLHRIMLTEPLSHHTCHVARSCCDVTAGGVSGFACSFTYMAFWVSWSPPCISAASR